MISRLVPVALVAIIAVAPAAQAATPTVYKNCTNLNKTYPHGLGKAKAHDHVTSGKPVTTFTKRDAKFAQAMKYNKNLDRDKDSIACEKK